MQNASKGHLPRLAWFTIATVVGGGCDLQTKSWAEESLGALSTKSMMVLQPWLEFSLTYNRGTAFSLIPDLGASRLIFGILALLTIGLLVFAVIRWKSGRSEAIALGALAAGALGNGLDRAFREAPGGGTGVVDFVKLNYPWGGSWPIFNVADVLVAVGLGYFILRSLTDKDKDKDKDKDTTAGESSVEATPATA